MSTARLLACAQLDPQKPDRALLALGLSRGSEKVRAYFATSAWSEEFAQNGLKRFEILTVSEREQFLGATLDYQLLTVAGLEQEHRRQLQKVRQLHPRTKEMDERSLLLLTGLLGVKRGLVADLALLLEEEANQSIRQRLLAALGTRSTRKRVGLPMQPSQN